MFRSTIGLKNFGELYDILLGFGITIVVDFLKWLDQYPISKHALAITIMFFKHVLSLIMYLRCSYESLSGPDTDMLLHLTIALLNSSSENNVHSGEEYESNSFSTLSSIWQNWAMLNEEWRACYRSSKSKQGWPLYLIVSMVGSLHLLIQLISFQELCFFLAISWILRSKKDYFLFLTVFWKVFQSLIFFKALYFARFLLYLLFHQLFACFVILTIFEFFVQILFMMLAKLLTTLSKLGISKTLDMSKFFNDVITSLINNSSSLLFFW